MTLICVLVTKELAPTDPYSYSGDQHFLSHSLDITRELVRKVQTQSGPTESAHPAASPEDSHDFQAGAALRPAPFFLSQVLSP